MKKSGIVSLCMMSTLLAGCSSEAAFHLAEPIHGAANRPTPLAFGMYVTPDSEKNPIDPPERFTGYHVGVDYEVTQEELKKDVPIYAICTGAILYSGFAEGYGGLVTQFCTIQGEPMTVLYGHVKNEGLPAERSQVQAGEEIAVLAPARSDESGLNRKHLHLGIHRGEETDVRGYVQREEEIFSFLDPQTILPLGGIGMFFPDMKPYWME